MKTTLLHVRRLAVVAALLGVVVSPRAAWAQSQLDASEAGAFLGSWTVAVESDFGPMAFSLELMDEGGKVAAKVGLPDPTGAGAGPPVAVTDITLSGEALVLSYEFDAEGKLLPVALFLTPSDDGLAAVFEIADGAFSASGSATRESN